mmetsp:Transcript_32796/g.85832  ORF Transcript_32796/g.85832 Transcript_32796/m.85832 type:complete len:276 (+) Transcript_32796:1766-2593(+)
MRRRAARLYSAAVGGCGGSPVFRDRPKPPIDGLADALFGAFCHRLWNCTAINVGGLAPLLSKNRYTCLSLKRDFLGQLCNFLFFRCVENVTNVTNFLRAAIDSLTKAGLDICKLRSLTIGAKALFHKIAQHGGSRVRSFKSVPFKHPLEGGQKPFGIVKLVRRLAIGEHFPQQHTIRPHVRLFVEYGFVRQHCSVPLLFRQGFRGDPQERQAHFAVELPPVCVLVAHFIVPLCQPEIGHLENASFCDQDVPCRKIHVHNFDGRKIRQGVGNLAPV